LCGGPDSWRERETGGGGGRAERRVRRGSGPVAAWLGWRRGAALEVFRSGEAAAAGSYTATMMGRGVAGRLSKRWRWVVALGTAGVGVVAVAGGCAGTELSKEGVGAYAGMTEDGAEVIVVNPFSPTELRVHPLTRVVVNAQSGRREIEAHVELIDRFGHPVKALGVFNFSLYRTGGTGDPTEQLMRWTIDLEDPAANAEPYDLVTRTYRVVLAGAPDEPRGERGLLLVARMTVLDGRTISSTHRF